MTETKFTPGPWSVGHMPDIEIGGVVRHKGGPFRDNDGSHVVTASEDGRVATVSFCGTAKRGQAHTASDLEGLANARLIAAAPDLYDSIDPDTLDAIADEICVEFKHASRAGSLRGIAKRQRAAMLKARGEAP